MDRIGIGVQEADGDGLDLVGQQLINCSYDFCRVECAQDFTVAVDTLVDLQAQATFDH